MSRVWGKAYFVYVLWSEQAHRFYIGISEDPAKRLHQHNQENIGWTARYRPWRLVYRERHPNYQSARKRELELKAQKTGRGFFARTGLDPHDFSRLPGS
jgi:predicted GIY-YIG superfamily endonuclease